MPNKKIKGFKRASMKKPAIRSRGRTGKRKLWTNENMEAAMLSAAKTEMSANKAADLYGVPRSTLKDRLSGRVVHGTNPGPKPYLTRDEETELSAHLLQASSIGLGRTRRDVKSIVGSFVKSKGLLKGKTVSNGWWEKFLKRNPTLSLRSGDSTAGVRLNAMTAENMKAYFDLLQEVYDEFDFDSHPEAIYNMDETGVPLEPRPPKVIAKRGQKKVRCRTSGQKAQITVIGCGSATGQILPPFIIYSAKKLNHLWMRDEVTGSRYGISDKGWVDQKLFYSWLKDHFLHNAASHRPLLLLLDGHSSHFEPQSIEFAKEHDIVIFCLPPHTTHECQPLDVGLFGPLKRYWQRECHKFYQKNPGLVITKLNFNRVFRVAWLKAVSPSNICGGFRKSGVFPFNRDAVTVLTINGDNNDGNGTVSAGGSDDHGEGSGDLGDEGSEIVGGGGSDDHGEGSGDLSDEGSEIVGGGGSDDHGEGSGDLGDEGSEIVGGEGSDDHGEGSGDLGDEVPEGSKATDDGMQIKSSGDLEESAEDNDPVGEDVEHLGGSGDFETLGDRDRSQVTTSSDLSFSIEEELRFAARYEEEYDLHDEKYEAWLKLHHPETLNTSPKDSTHIDPVTPLTSRPKSTAHTPSYSTHTFMSTGSDQPSMSTLTTTPSATTPKPRSTVTPKALLSAMATPNTPKSTTSNRSPLSDLLNLPAIAHGSKQSKTPNTGHARVLTSRECLQLLKEKEEKKKQVQLEKERRKIERELKKKQKEEEQQLKAAEKAKRAAEREATKAKRQAAKAEKEAARVEKAIQKSLSGTKRSSPSNPRSSRISKKVRSDSEVEEDANHCCVCFGSYQEDIDTGREWIQCNCKRWLHEDCVDSEDTDIDGKLCPLC